MYKRIRDLREDNDLTQSYIATEVLYVSQRVYSNYECGDVSIPVKSLIKLAKYYNTSTDYILGLTDIKKSYPKK
ncbi:helix-turn-helix domain-containing protein [Listeria seeligeri]|uniref:helix-turn-helix domain-containing protein n=1 Tax=Listeria seeligeri TaxID=1640 RepID=UPI00162AF612|nr:helix-turn-helix transcriptional regulator [Listeria seeligeri]MBC1527431.1 helix-turn-helix transcriptional regulator [Listeria seeligeri]MBC1731656.1 helix-turn-helix transcriptional regulator [Listeria seeligeri]MBC1809483.1 helix-turn-helix transcriptional regulator [Listeria seeligeri]MBC1894281.1 helix-turn-helix transcriptional regulator [Listeria seeligeri]MBC1931941.1 helix-turn-helix transcriptional regulator [Listeria seeligeri]